MWIQASYAPILDPDGRPFKVVKYATDTTAQAIARMKNEHVRGMMESVAAGDYSPEDRNRYAGLCHSLWDSDYFMVTPDFASYWDAQRRMDEMWRDRTRWRRTL
mgnify:CR=1 FL=1